MRDARLLGWLLAAAMVTGAAAAKAQGDPEKGERVFNKCRACHVVDQKQNRVGPHLVDIFGRGAGSVEGFNYSDAMEESGIIWNEDTVAEYLAEPRGYIPGNRMAFPGLRKEQEIADVLAYLREATAAD